MKTGIHLEGGDVDQEAVEAVAESVRVIFKAGAKYNMDQETVRTALGLIGTMGTVNHAMISNCHVQG